MDISLTAQQEPFSWSFVGAVVIISMAVFGLVITTVYLCWLHEIIPTIREKFTLRSDSKDGNLKDSASGFLHPATEHHQTDSNVSNAEEGSTRRGGKHDTKQRVVNKRLHDLKQGNTFSEVTSLSETPISRDLRNSPEKPEKSQLVRNFVNRSGVSECSSECSEKDATSEQLTGTSSETRESRKHSHSQDKDGDSQSKKPIGSSSNNDNHPTMSNGNPSGNHDNPIGDHGDHLGNHSNLVGDHGSHAFSHKHSSHGNATQHTGIPIGAAGNQLVSHHTQKWEILREKRRKRLLETCFRPDLPYKMGRNRRAVAPEIFYSESTYKMCSCVDKVINRNRELRALRINVLKDLRKSGNLGLNLHENPVSRGRPLTDTDHLTGDSSFSSVSLTNSGGVTYSPAPSGVLPRKPYQNTDCKPSEVPRNTSVLADQLTQNDPHSTQTHQSTRDDIHSTSTASAITHHVLGDCDKEMQSQLANPIQTTVDGLRHSSPNAESRNTSHTHTHSPLPNHENEIQELPAALQDGYTLDPYQDVFGNYPDRFKKEEKLVRRVDSLFYSTTPSSVDSLDTVFEAQATHNSKEEGLKNNSIAMLDSGTLPRSSEDLAMSPDSLEKSSISMTSTGNMSSISSFKSTTLPSISPQLSDTSSISPQLSDTSSSNPYTGKLKFFEGFG